MLRVFAIFLLSALSTATLADSGAGELKLHCVRFIGNHGTDEITVTDDGTYLRFKVSADQVSWFAQRIGKQWVDRPSPYGRDSLVFSLPKGTCDGLSCRAPLLPIAFEINYLAGSQELLPLLVPSVKLNPSHEEAGTLLFALTVQNDHGAISQLTLDFPMGQCKPADL
jgi:hypothetical protein